MGYFEFGAAVVAVVGFYAKDEIFQFALGFECFSAVLAFGHNCNWRVFSG